MTGHFDLGNDSDVPFGGIGYHFADLVLRVVPAVAALFVGDRVFVESADLGSGSIAADLGQARVAFDLDTPALVVGQMPVEGVEFARSHPIEVMLDEPYRKEVAADVEMQAAVAVARMVLDRDAGKVAPFVGQLEEGLQAVEETGVVAGRELRAACGNVDSVAFGRDSGCGVASQNDGIHSVPCRRGMAWLDQSSGQRSQIFGPDVETFPFDAASGRDEDDRTEFGLDGLGNDLQLSGRGRNS